MKHAQAWHVLVLTKFAHLQMIQIVASSSAPALEDASAFK